MIKYKTTKKAICNSCATIISIGYCDLQHLLAYISPNAYTSGIYGWNADIYSIGNVAICTGYRPFGDINPDYDITRSYNERARIIRHESYGNDMHQQLSDLLDAYIKEVTK